MDDTRLGSVLRALRRRNGWTQLELASRAGISQATISRIERGHWQDLAVRTLRRVFGALDARLDLRAAWRGGEVDRLVDERHARAVAVQADELRRLGWDVAIEVTFNHFGDRGSIDLLALHAPSRTVIVDETKSEIASEEETLRRLDVKVRLAPAIAEERWGVKPALVVPLLSVIDSSPNRRRVARLRALLDAAFPLRGWALRRWLADPTSSRPLGALRFLPIGTPRSVIQTPRRVRHPSAAAPATPRVSGDSVAAEPAAALSGLIFDRRAGGSSG
jgi:transcriptional regulator with XRE-family HTH domain